MIRKIKYAFMLLLAMVQGVDSMADVVLTVKNSGQEQRLEVAEFDANEVWKALGVAQGSPVRVLNRYGLPEACQITHDNKLLVETTVIPGGTARFYVKPGTPDPTQDYAVGKLYPWRVDDFVWENDRCSYRAYGPALQRTGEKAFGMAVWLKSTPYPDVEKRYAVVYNGHRISSQMRKDGRKQEADSLDQTVSLHLDHGTGLDCYNVGPSLGCGTPAIMLGDSIVMPYCFKEYRVLDNGPLRFTLELVYNTEKIDGQNVTEHRIISLDKWSFFNKMTVWYDGLKKPMDVCGGVVVHTEKASDLKLAPNYVAYTDPTDSAERHQFEIYVAALFPNGADATQLVRDPWHKKAGIVGNAVGVKRGVKNNERFTYYFGASWCKSGTPNQRVWYMQIEDFINNLKQPLQTAVTVK